VACDFIQLGWRVPPWVALLSLLEDFADTHDDPRAFPRRKWHETYCRWDWRCAAPLCTARVVQDHHIRFASHGGSDAASNQLALCPADHLQGVHGEFAVCFGDGPLGLTWGIGREDVRVWYRNERKVEPPLNWKQR
jgi:hypothetical protein